MLHIMGGRLHLVAVVAALMLFLIHDAAAEEDVACIVDDQGLILLVFHLNLILFIRETENLDIVPLRIHTGMCIQDTIVPYNQSLIKPY